MENQVSRRRVIQYGFGAAAAIAVPELFESGWLERSPATAARSVGRRELRSPHVLRSHRGKLKLKLVCRPATVNMGAAKPVRTWTYDGIVPGYTWELRGGDVLAVDLHNHLPKLPPEPHMTMDRPHQWTTTNLHTHGLPVSPTGIAEHIFLEIPPGDRQRYRIPIPHDHPAGLFWYHPHKRGGVCQQVRGGMAGIIVIRGGLDRVPEIRAAREQIMVLQSIELGGGYELMARSPTRRRGRRVRCSAGACSMPPRGSSCRCGSRATTCTRSRGMG